jgi:hypothetical protein
MIGKPAVISYPFTVLAWDERVRERIMSFWRGRGFRFTTSEGDVLRGRRGSIGANLCCISADMLMAEITIERTSPVEIRCTMRVDTRFQYIVEWNSFTWLLEMDTFARFLQHDDLREQEWREFRRDNLREYLFHMTSLGILGRRVSEKWKRRIRHLN